MDTAVEPLRQALIKRGEDGQTGIDEQGRVKAFEMDDQRLKCLGCRLCTPDKNDGSRHKDRLRAAWSLMAYRNHNSEVPGGPKSSRRAGRMPNIRICIGVVELNLEPPESQKYVAPETRLSSAMVEIRWLACSAKPIQSHCEGHYITGGII